MNKLHIIGGYCDVTGSGQAWCQWGKCLWWMIRMRRRSPKHRPTMTPYGTGWQIHQSFVSNSDSFNQNTIAFQFFSREWAKNLNVSRSPRFSFYHEIPYSMSRIYVIMGSCRGNPSEEPAGRASGAETSCSGAWWWWWHGHNTWQYPGIVPTFNPHQPSTPGGVSGLARYESEMGRGG